MDLQCEDDSSPKRCAFYGCGRGLGVPGWKAYNRSLDLYPVPTKAITSFCGWFLGDFITQTMLTKGHPFDFNRSIIISSFGLFFHGPVGHVVYGTSVKDDSSDIIEACTKAVFSFFFWLVDQDNLDLIIVGTGPWEVVAKICIDQFLWCPVFMMCYFSYLGILNGHSVALIAAQIQQDLFTAVTTSWKIWPLAHAIQFRWVATKHRIIYINCIEVCFIMFLSFLANQ